MELTKLKAYTTMGIIGLAVIPKLTYYSADKYIRGYNHASAYLTETTEYGLNKIGLASIKDEASLDAIIIDKATSFKLNPKLLKALISTESNENPDALSLKSCIGYAQILPSNYKRCGLKSKSELWNTEKNIQCGAQILSEELVTYKGDLEKALFSYNGGSLAFKNKYPESAAYSKKVMTRFAQSSVTE